MVGGGVEVEGFELLFDGVGCSLEAFEAVIMIHAYFGLLSVHFMFLLGQLLFFFLKCPFTVQQETLAGFFTLVRA